MAESLERLQSKRKQVRSRTSRLIQKIEKALQTEFVLEELKTFLDQLLAKANLITELDAQIEAQITDNDQLESEIDGSQEFQEYLIQWKGRIARAIQRSEREDEQSTDSEIVRVGSTVKLPRLSLNKFYGDPSQWQSFWNQFDSTIHSNASLAKTEKFSYLKTYLGGTAQSAVEGLALTPDNYDTAIVTLTERFGRKDLVVNAHMTKLLNLTPVKKSSDVNELRRLFDSCSIQIRSLESMGIVSETYGGLLCPVLMKMIPQDLALEFSRQRDSDSDWNAKECLAFLQKEVESRERAVALTKMEPETKNAEKQSNSKFVRTEQKPKPNIASTATFNASVDSCIYCEKARDHRLEDCHSLSLQEKKEKIQKLGRCFNCLGIRHSVKDCLKKSRCMKCRKKHHTSLCNASTSDNNTQVPNKTVDANAKDTLVSTVSPNYPGNRNTILLQTAGALAKGENGTAFLRCLLDAGSQRTFIREDIVKRLKFKVLGEETLSVHIFGDETPNTSTFPRVRVQLSNLRDKDTFIEIEALVTPCVSNAILCVPDDNLREVIQKKKLQLADVAPNGPETDTSLGMLIGSDYYWELVSGKIERLKGGLVALETKFGWCIQGPTPISALYAGSTDVSVMKISAVSEEGISKQLKKFWELESLGIQDNNSKHTIDEEAAINYFDTTVKFREGRYEVRLPWKAEQLPLNDNYLIAKGRFNSLTRKFKSDLQFYNKYKEAMGDLIEKGIAERVDVTIPDGDNSKIYYIPHQAVVKEERSTSKVRIVFDASSHDKGCKSLNDCLLTGPNLNGNLLTIMLRFRLHRIAFMADIEKAFLQISIAPEDRNAVRFLWSSNALDDTGPKTEVFRMTRVLFGISSSPFLLAATIKHHLNKNAQEYPETSQILADNLYVDDFISGSETVEKAKQITGEAKEILGTASMNLRKWRTNSNELRQIWENNNVEQEQPPIDDQPHSLKVLGFSWTCSTDNFIFDLNNLIEFIRDREDTKRFILQTASRVYDPMGFLSPVTMSLKIMLQELWEQGLHWDDNIPADLQCKWQIWCEEFPELQILAIPRYYFGSSLTSSPHNIELHVFCDSSMKAYGAVAYLRYEIAGDKIATTFVASKTRVAPLKSLTIPRLELMSTLLGSRLKVQLVHDLNIDENNVFMWSDSTIALYWIHGTAKLWKPFIANRVAEIHNNTNPNRWNHCKGSNNPADPLTRGFSAKELLTSELWWKGPPWLSEKIANWPEQTMHVTEANTELIQSERKSCLTVFLQTNDEQTNELLDLTKYSTISRVLRVTAWIYRFINNAKATSKTTGCLNAEELTQAETYWEHCCQRTFKEELTNLQAGKPIQKKSPIFELNPFLSEDGLLCVGGRLQMAKKLHLSEKHPKILPSSHTYTELLIKDVHEKLFHAGVSATLSHIREKYWIPKGRQKIKTVNRKCIVCMKFRLKPGNETVAPLPEDRITQSKPFEVVGIDFAGPLYLKNDKNAVVKAYITLFTCGVTRAVHLELVPNLTTESFLLAFRRFTARRGLCSVIYTDNAKTFKKANQDLKELWKSVKHPMVETYLGQSRISWKFILEKSPWWGGFYERLVGSVKLCLRKQLGKASLRYEEMETVLVEVEATINSRPITYVYNDASEPDPLTPSHLLLGEKITLLPSNHSKAPDVTTVTKQDIRKRAIYRQRLLENFWTRWRKEYLLDLRTAHIIKNPEVSTNIKKDDIVLINEVKVPRHMWKLGRVCELYPGRDKKIRSVLLKLPNAKTIRRPIQHISPLEIG